jgi:hypothetical protein
MDKENQALEKAKMVYETGEIIRTDILAGLVPSDGRWACHLPVVTW